MRIERESGDSVGSVWAVLSQAEADELMLALIYYFDDDVHEPGWHCHIGPKECELTVEIEPDPST
jgi:hypothetical protein